MENPKKPRNYTTIFRDGSVINENPWLILPDGHGKWYWDEEMRGGVVAWTEIPEGGYKYHKFYRLPDWELRELLGAQHLISALDNADAYDLKRYNKAISDYLDSLNCESFAEVVQNDLDTYYAGYEVN